MERGLAVGDAVQDSLRVPSKSGLAREEFHDEDDKGADERKNEQEFEHGGPFGSMVITVFVYEASKNLSQCFDLGVEPVYLDSVLGD